MTASSVIWSNARLPAWWPPSYSSRCDGRWWRLDEGIDLVSFDYQSSSWETPRRVVGIRQHIKYRDHPKGKTLSLFAADPVQGSYRYGAIVTSLDLPAQEIWRTYRGRIDCENRIKELKYDFAVDSICLNDFFATEAAWPRGKDVQHTLQTLRFKLFAKAGYITTEGRKNILKLAVVMCHRAWFEGLWNQSKTFDLSVKFSPVFSP